MTQVDAAQLDYGEVTVTTDTAVPGFGAIWEAAGARAMFHTLSLEDYCRIPVDDGTYRRVILHQAVEGGPDLILPCVGITREHRFVIGSRRLFTMKVPAVNLLNYWVLEGHAPGDIARAIGRILSHSGAAIVTLSEVPEGSALSHAIPAFSWPMAPLVLNSTPTQHWLADLPEDFEDYVAGLSRNTSKSARRYMNRLEKKFDVRLETVTRPDQVERFLSEAERINRKTYQWALGERVENTPETQEHFLKLAAENRLRSYLLLLDGAAVAFKYGRIEDGFYASKNSGFDPDYGEHRIGTVLLLHVMRDLIEATTCRIYDFGMGGDDMSYKSSYGTRSVTCNSYYILRLDRPRGLILWTLQGTLNRLKSGIDRMISPELKRKLAKRLRKT